MDLASLARRWRDWFPIPTPEGKLKLRRWVLLEANRLAVTGALLTFVFVTLMGVGTVWTFEMQNLLTETSAVENLLDTFLSGMILLVSIVVSINSIVLSHDITSVGNQEDRIQGAMKYRENLGRLTDTGESPTDPASFLQLMSRVISERAELLESEVKGSDGEIPESIQEYASSIKDTATHLGTVDELTGAEFAVLWKGMDFDYGPHMDRSRTLKSARDTNASESVQDRFESLIQAFETFAIGKEYFKTLYYTQEVSHLSRTLLVIALPAILFNSVTVLAINARIFPDVWVFGLPPLQSFVATAFTVSLAPYLLLTSYMLRLATVAQRTSSAGIFSLG